MRPGRFDAVDFTDVENCNVDRTDRRPKSDVPDDSRRAKRLLENVHRALLATGQMWLRDVVVDANANGQVMLQGRVPTYYLKQLAQSIALAVTGVKSLENQIAVQ